MHRLHPPALRGHLLMPDVVEPLVSGLFTLIARVERAALLRAVIDLGCLLFCFSSRF